MAETADRPEVRLGRTAAATVGWSRPNQSWLAPEQQRRRIMLHRPRQQGLTPIVPTRQLKYRATRRTCSVRVLARLPYERSCATSTFSFSANRATATCGAEVSLSVTKPSHGNVHSARARPSRSARSTPANTVDERPGCDRYFI